MPIKITYFVHGTTTDNEQNLATGQAPGELSELGIKQSHELKNKLSSQNFDAVFCSDLKRAVDSAEIVFNDKHQIIQDKKLRECNYGDLTHKPTKNFKDEMTKYIDTPFPNGESYKDVEDRIACFLDYLMEKYKNKNIAIVAHQAPQLALEVLLNKKAWEQAIDEDWRKTNSWQPGWDYKLNEFQLFRKG